MSNRISYKDVRKRQEQLEWLCETSMGVTEGTSVLKAKGWKEIVEDIPGDERKMFLAAMLENNREMLLDAAEGGLLMEDSQSINVGNWEKFGFPVISMVAENLIAPEIVSVQPLSGPTGTVFFMDYVASTTKGTVTKGDTLWGSRGGHGPSRDYASENITGEPIAAAGGAISGSFAFAPIRPGTVLVQSGSSTYTDDSNGNIAGGTINYQTGAFTFTAGTSANPVTAAYSWNSESSPDLPGLEFTMTSSPIFAQRFALKGRWSFEAEQMLKALHGTKAEASITAAISAEIQFEIDRHILTQLWNFAGAGLNNWNANVPAGISFTEHKLSFADAIHELSMFIYRATDRVMGNWALVGVQGAAILYNHPLFEAAPHKSEVDGVTLLGTLNGKYKVYVDPHADPASYLVGYKGDDWMRTGYVFAPWLLLYRTPTISLDDFVNRAAFASQFGAKPINSKYYAKGSILNYPTVF